MDSTSNFPASFPPLAADSIRRHEGSIEITTRPDPRTGSTHRLFDPLDLIHAVTAHIPDRGRHCVRYYGACQSRTIAESLQRRANPAGTSNAMYLPSGLQTGHESNSGPKVRREIVSLSHS